MSISKITAAVAALSFVFAAGVAGAQEATPDTWITEARSVKTVEQVRTELAQARADGSIKAVSAGYIEESAGQKTRAEVKAELAMARASGELAAQSAEAYAFAPAAVSPASATTLAHAAR